MRLMRCNLVARASGFGGSKGASPLFQQPVKPFVLSMDAVRHATVWQAHHERKVNSIGSVQCA